MARMRSSRRHPLVASLIEVWIDRYRHIEDDYDDCDQMSPCRTISESAGACSQPGHQPPLLGAHFSTRKSKSDHSDKSESSTHDSDPHL